MQMELKMGCHGRDGQTNDDGARGGSYHYANVCKQDSPRKSPTLRQASEHIGLRTKRNKSFT